MALASLFTLLDDIASVLDDVALMTKVAAKKTAGVVGDDLALNANQVTGAAAEREIPIVWEVAKGSLVNKVILIPIALLLAAFAPKWITPLLMIGGAYLCFEGAEKLLHKILPQDDHTEKPIVTDSLNSEKEKIRGAIRTDFILSAEIVILALGAMDSMGKATMLSKVVALSLVGVGMTVAVYGLVAMIVKMDDFGFHLMRKPSKLVQWLGKGLVRFVPWLMRGLSVVGTLAMFMVGGGIFVHNVAWLHHFHWNNFLADTGFTIGVGIAVGAAACAVVLPLGKMLGKKH